MKIFPVLGWKGEEWRVGEAVCPCHVPVNPSTWVPQVPRVHTHIYTSAQRFIIHIILRERKVTSKITDKHLSLQRWPEFKVRYWLEFFHRQISPQYKEKFATWPPTSKKISNFFFLEGSGFPISICSSGKSNCQNFLLLCCSANFWPFTHHCTGVKHSLLLLLL